MHAFRFYLPPELLNKGPVRIVGPDAHHVRNVLRLSIGDEITLFDGVNSEYSAKITSIARDEVHVSGLRKTREAVPQKPRITLWIAVFSKLDFVIEKSTELGVTGIIPVITTGTHIRLRPDDAGNRLERWERIAVSASMQSGRITLPRISVPEVFNSVLDKRPPANVRLVASLREDSRPILDVLDDISVTPEDVDVCVGPPADFSQDELDAAIGAGFVPVGLSSHTLRTETAALSALAVISTFFYSRS